MLELVNAVRIRHYFCVFVGWEFSFIYRESMFEVRDTVPEFLHAGNIAVAGINHFASLTVVLRLLNCWLFLCIVLLFVERRESRLIGGGAFKYFI